MKRFYIIVFSALLLIHIFVGWLLVSFPKPDPGETFRLWRLGYDDAKLPYWHLPAIAEDTMSLWLPFYFTSSFPWGHLPLALRLCCSCIIWFAIALGACSSIRLLWGKRHKRTPA